MLSVTFVVKGPIAPACCSNTQQKSLPPSRKDKRRHKTHCVHQEEGTKVTSRMKCSIRSSSPSLHLTHSKRLSKSKINDCKWGWIQELLYLLSQKLLGRPSSLTSIKLHKSSVILKAYADQPMQVTGQLYVHICYRSQVAPLILVVVVGNNPSILG